MVGIKLIGEESRDQAGALVGSINVPNSYVVLPTRLHEYTILQPEQWLLIDVNSLPQILINVRNERLALGMIREERSKALKLNK
jgi:hypothetical protein